MQPQLTVRRMRIDELHLNPRNPNRHERRQIRKIADSIRTFGFLVPVLIDRDNNVIAGHGRILAARELGMLEIAAIQAEHLTEAQVTAYMIADNQLCRIAEWDDRILNETLKQLSELDLDFSLEVTGFEMGEIDLRIESLTNPVEDEENPAAMSSASSGPPVTKLGDTWLLGPHKVACADAREAASYEALLGGHHASLAFTDPPYNVKIDGYASGLGSTRHREFAMAVGEMSKVEYRKFLSQVFRHLADACSDGAVLFLCIDWRHFADMLEALDDVGCDLLNLCVWVKHNAGMGSLYRSQHELVLVLKRGREHHRNNVELGRHGRNRTNVWHYPGANNFGRCADEGNLLALHPTPKPVAMVADAIMDCSARWAIVLDVFLGSGTTLIAAERTGRRCFGMELDPLYVDTAIRRWQAQTGKIAHHAVSGESFDELARNTEIGHG